MVKAQSKTWTTAVENTLLRRGALAAFYLGVGAAVAFGGAPIWALLVFLTLPLAWRLWRAPVVTLAQEWAFASALLFGVAYLIQWIAR